LERGRCQEAFESGISVPPVEVGDQATVYFQIDASRSRAAELTVEFVLFDSDAPGGHVSPGRRGAGVVVLADAHRHSSAGPPHDGLSEVVHPQAESSTPERVRPAFRAVSPVARAVPPVASELASSAETSDYESGRRHQQAREGGA
jgi:hypothetical protein